MLVVDTSAAELKRRGADAVYVAVAESLGAPLVTWDEERLTRLAGAITVQGADSLPPPEARAQPAEDVP